MARAVYARCKFLIMDDTFSGLDPETEEAIFFRLLGRNGILRTLGMTVLLATHAAHRLSWADHIVALASDGSVSEQGTFEQLRHNGGYVSSLLARHRSENREAVDEAPDRHHISSNDYQTIAAVEPVRPLGDLQVYRYYFTAVGWGKSFAFLALMISFAFFSFFPGKPKQPPFLNYPYS